MRLAWHGMATPALRHAAHRLRPRLCTHDAWPRRVARSPTALADTSSRLRVRAALHGGVHDRQGAHCLDGTAARRLLLISAYTIGKERLFLEVFRRCRTPLLVTAQKLDVLRLLDWPADLPCDEVFTTDPARTRIHIVGWNWIGETWPYFRPNYANIELYASKCVFPLHCT
jgi:DNA ligase 1